MVVIVLGVLVALVAMGSYHLVGAMQVGLVTKRFSFRRLTTDTPLAFRGEAGYQAKLLMPGLRLKLWPVSKVAKHPWVQVPAGEIGVVISQVGAPLPIGATSARYQAEFGNLTDLEYFMASGGEKGVQRPVLPPGSLLPIHPVGFIVITSRTVYGVPATIMRWLTNGKGNGIAEEGPLGVTPGTARATTPSAETATDVPTQDEGSGNEPPTRTSDAT